jgi:hypothetical protein
MKRLSIVLVATFVIATITPIASADLSITGWGITQYVSADKKMVGTKSTPSRKSVSENPYFTNSKLRLILKGGTEKANLWLQFSACTKEGALSGVPHKAGFLDCKLNVQLTDNAKLTAGRFCVPFGLINAHSTYNLPVGFYSTGIYHVLGKNYALRATGIVLSGKMDTLSGAVAYVNAKPGQHKNKLLFAKAGMGLGEYVHAGISILNGKLDDAGTKFAANGVDISYANGPVRAELEYAKGKVGDTKNLGYYLQASYDITDVTTIRARYDVADPDTDKDNNEITTTTLAYLYSISDNSYAAVVYDIADDEAEPSKIKTLVLQLAVKFSASLL